jgi:poly(hydroxyalkanoate) granule-associated protein
MNTTAAENTQPTPEQTAAEDVEKTTDKVASAVRSVWLAVLGIPVAATESGKEAFHYLVERGEKVEAQGKEHLKSAGHAVETVTSTVGDTLRDVGGKAKSFAGKSEEAIDQKIADKLKSMGVPTKEDLQALNERVDAIAEKLDSMGKDEPPVGPAVPGEDE